jgi:hypothetical protein
VLLLLLLLLPLLFAATHHALDYDIIHNPSTCC